MQSAEQEAYYRDSFFEKETKCDVCFLADGIMRSGCGYIKDEIMVML